MEGREPKAAPDEMAAKMVRRGPRGKALFAPALQPETRRGRHDRGGRGRRRLRDPIGRRACREEHMRVGALPLGRGDPHGDRYRLRSRRTRVRAAAGQGGEQRGEEKQQLHRLPL
ncbi:hypothetical protein CKY28_01785 [Sphingomonas lenta]|uniref:Uncharacterized protein n=1 Tax=Sphingomonas lenta TaxID=1141887 RepID=A0A2A2SJU9_9SPHN|nr:hypothetical protein CKY28_01785 [Sphingomonas lenta]